MEVEPRIANSTNATAVAVAEITGERGWRVGKKCLCVVFGLARRSRVRQEKEKEKRIWGHPIAQATSYCLLPDTFWLRASKNVFKVGSVKFAKSLSLPSRRSLSVSPSHATLLQVIDLCGITILGIVRASTVSGSRQFRPSAETQAACDGCLARPPAMPSSWVQQRDQCYFAVQWSWFARVNVLCNLSRKKLREVAA